SGIVPVNLASPQRVRAHSALIAHHVGVAEELTAHVEVEQKACGDALELELVVPATDPPWIHVTEHSRRSADRKPLLCEQVAAGVAKEGVAGELAVRLTRSGHHRCATLGAEHNSSEPRRQCDDLALVAR